MWYGTNSLFNDRYGISNQKVVEVNCNAIAAEIILPNEFFTKSWNDNKTEVIGEKIERISKEFNCGITVVARRALDNGYITREEYKRNADCALELYNKSKENSNSGGNYYNTVLSRVDHRLLIALNDSANEGKTAFTDIYRLTNTTRKTFENLIEKAREDL